MQSRTSDLVKITLSIAMFLVIGIAAGCGSKNAASDSAPAQSQAIIQQAQQNGAKQAPGSSSAAGPGTPGGAAPGGPAMGHP